MSAELVTSPVLTGAEAARARRIDLVGPVDDSNALTPTGPWAAEAAKAFDRARQEGHARGANEGRMEGLAQARAETAAEVARLADAVDILRAEVDARVAAAIDDLAQRTTGLALVIAEAILDREVRTAHDPGADAIARCLAMAPLPGAVVAHVNPADAERLGPLPQVEGRPFTVVADPSLASGEARVTVADTLVDGRLDDALARVAELLGEPAPGGAAGRGATS
ncbi:MAG: FliH/SctL family protein [Acidimicrobiales bacterium]